MKYTVFCVSLVCLLSACNNSDWSIVAEKGPIKIVEIDKKNAKDADIYRKAMPKICPNGKDCQALFWEEGKAPSSTTISDSDIRSMSAYYAVQVEPYQKNLKWNCAIFPKYSSDRLCIENNVETIRENLNR